MKHIKTIAASMILAGAAFTAEAQKSLVNGIYAYLSQPVPELVNAKTDIDKASQEPSTANWGPMWFWRGKTYAYIALDKNGQSIDPDAGYKAAESFVNYLKAPDKKREEEEDEALRAEVSNPTDPSENRSVGLIYLAAIAGYNQGIQLQEKGKNQEAIKCYEKVAELFQFDKNEIFTSKGFSKNQVYKAAYSAAYADSNQVQSREYIQKLLDNGYTDYTLYLMLATSYLNEKNYDKALEQLTKGKQEYPEHAKYFLTEEINIYFERGQMAALKTKLDEAIASDPGNELYYFNRGILHQQSQHYGPAMADFNKVLELKPDFGDAKVSVASVMVDSAKILETAMEGMDAKSPKYASTLSAYNSLLKQALPILEQVYADGLITDHVEEVGLLRIIRDVYSKMGNEEKRVEFNALIKQKKKDYGLQ